MRCILTRLASFLGLRAPLAILAAALTLLPSPSAAVCTTTKTVRQAGGGDCTTIQQCVDAVPSSAFTGDYCINIDSATYSENVVIQDKSPVGFQLIIQTDPVVVSTVATISASPGNAAFSVFNTSVSLLNMLVVITDVTNYGVVASSAYVTISSVNVKVAAPGGSILTAGVSITSYNAVSYSTIDGGLKIVGQGSAVGWSTMTSAASDSALLFSAASSNTITQSYIDNPGGKGARLTPNSDYNTISKSTISNDSGFPALYLVGASFNTITQSYISNLAGNGNGVLLSTSSKHNTISLSTMTSNNSSAYSLALEYGSSSNTITQCSLTNPAGTALLLHTSADYNTISQSTLTNNSAASTVWIDTASNNAITQSYIANPAGPGVAMTSASNHNAINQSAIMSNTAASAALMIQGPSSSNTITQSIITNLSGYGVRLQSGSDYNTFSQSTMTGNGAGYSALYCNAGCSYNTISQSSLANLTGGKGFTLDGNSHYNTVTKSFIVSQGGDGATLGYNSNYNTISQSTLTSNTAGYSALYIIESASNTIVDSYIQGSTAALVSGSTGTVIGGSVLVATNTAGSALQLDGGSVNLTLSTSSLRAPSAGAGLYLADGNNGSISIATNTIAGAQYGMIIATQAAGASLSAISVTFAGLAPGATAVQFAGGTFISTFTGMDFDSSIGANVNGSRLNAGSRITMNAPSGARAGAPYENDPGSHVDWKGVVYPGCVVTQNVGAGQDYLAISAAVAALPTTLSGLSCVVIRDGGTYNEQVKVQGFTNNGFRIAIFADPGSGLTPVVIPPAFSTGAFVIMNASVTVAGIDIQASAAFLPYGVQASSAYVTISSVNVNSFTTIYVAGVTMSSDSSLSYSTITVQNAYGLIIGGSNNAVSYSTMTSSSAGFPALWLPGASSNTITRSRIANSAGTAAYLNTGANNNTISLSTMTGNAAGSYGLLLSGGVSNTISQSYIANTAGTGARLDSGSGYNTLSQSTMTSNAGGFYALIVSGASSNTVTQSYVSNPSGDGLSLGGNYNTISQSAIESNSSGDAALFLSFAHYNTITQSHVTNLAGNAANVFNSDFNTISLSTLTSNGVGNRALYLFTASCNTISQSYITNPAGYAAQLFSNSNFNTISQSTMASNSSSFYALYLQGALSNRISQSYATNASGYAAVLYSNANSNTISRSTMTSGAVSYAALRLDAVASNTLDNSYLQGSTAAYISGSTGTVFSTSELAADSAFGNALTLTGGSVNLTVASTTLRGGPSGRGLLLDLGNKGAVTIGSVTVTGAARGLEISTQGAGFTLAVDSITFRGLASGATAIHFLGGTFVSTMTLADFEDASVGANVSGEALDPASRITMNAHRGTRNGATYENDPASLVYWQYVVFAPSNFAGAVLSQSAIEWSWTDTSSDETGFRVMAGTVNVSGDLAVDATTWLQTGMGVNTSSGSMRVQSFTAFSTGDSSTMTVYSLAAAPSGLGSSSVSVTSATLTWTAGNPAGTIFELERSTGSGFALLISTTFATYMNTGLSPGSTYHYQVRALNGNSVATAYSSSITVPTPVAPAPNAPSAFAAVAQSTASILWTWTDNAYGELGFRVMAGAVNVSGNLAINATSWLQTGLSANTSSQLLLVQVYNSTGTGDSASLSRYTLAAAPSGPGASDVFQSSATVSWTAGNPAGTIYELERSTGTGFGLRISSAVAAYTDTSLINGSTYSYRVRALNGESIATVYSSSITFVTLPTALPAAPTSFAGAALSAASILWSWTDNAVNEDGYRVMSGAVNVSGDLAMDATTWLQTGLGINTVSGPLSVQVFNATGTVNSGTASKTTLAAIPSALAAADVYLTSGTLSWNANGNPGGTVFQLERSTGTGFGLQFAGSATYYFDQYMTPSTTHFYQVRALNGESVATAYSSSLTVVTVQAPPIPGAAGTPVGTALGTSSASWTWVLASGATNYYLYRPSDNSYLGASSAGPFVQTALSPNTAYGMRAAGVNYGGTGPLSPSATVYTFAAVASGGAAASITSTTLVASWALAGNPPATVAQLQRSTDAVVYSALTSAAVTSYSDADLLGCTTYYYRVRNVNGDGFTTSYSTFSGVTANTIPSPPAGLTAAANAGGTVGLSWGLSPTEGVTGYRLYWDAGTSAVSYGAAIAVFGPTETAYTTGVLTSSASYTFALRTVHRCGVVETAGALAMSGAATAPAAVRAAIKEPDSGRRINGDRVTILGELIAGTPSDVQQVLFQYKLAASTAWIDVDEANVNHSNPDFSFPYFVHADVTVMAAGSYDLRAVAYNTAGVPDPTPPAVRVVVDPVTPDISETLTVEGKIKKDQTVTNTVTSVVDTCGAGASDPAVRVTIPSGIVSNTTATVSVIANPAITTAAPTGQAFVGSAIKIDLSNGQTALNGTAEITLTYPDTVLFPSLLQIYYLNEATGQWSRDFASTVNTTSRTVSGRTSHFSTFAILLGTAFGSDLSNVQVYPVPFKPNGTNADEGRTFTHGDPNTGIIFSNLMAGSAIKIYTLTGRQVASLDKATIAGTVRWDARNQDGRDVASGAYFAVISAAGQKSVIKKLVIIR